MGKITYLLKKNPTIELSSPGIFLWKRKILLSIISLLNKIFQKRGWVFWDNDAQKEKDVLAKMKDLMAQLDECKEELRLLKKSRNNHIRKHEEDRVRWAKERNPDRAKADELLQFEKIEHRHSEEELGKTGEQLRDVSFKLLLAEETERKRISQEILSSSCFRI
jgi:hypothetical protein